MNQAYIEHSSVMVLVVLPVLYSVDVQIPHMVNLLVQSLFPVMPLLELLLQQLY